MGSGSYKNIYRELRPSFIRSDILVNKCWPFGQHPVALWATKLEKTSFKKTEDPFLCIFLVNKQFLSPEMSYRSYKNSYRELEHHFLRSEILVNTCWPFGQQPVALLVPQVKKRPFSPMKTWILALFWRKHGFLSV